MWNSPDISLTVRGTSPRLVKCVTHIMPVLLLNTCMGTNMQLTINGSSQRFPDKIFSTTFPWLLVKSPTFPWQLSNSMTFPGFPDKWSPCTTCVCVCVSVCPYNLKTVADLLGSYVGRRENLDEFTSRSHVKVKVIFQRVQGHLVRLWAAPSSAVRFHLQSLHFLAFVLYSSVS